MTKKHSFWWIQTVGMWVMTEQQRNKFGGGSVSITRGGETQLGALFSSFLFFQTGKIKFKKMNELWSSDENYS